jgi:LmbE family N-acetylglucosaminyl deacetylase
MKNTPRKVLNSPRNICLAFMAHPDDAEIFCGGTLALLASLGWEIHIATATAGDCGSTSLSPAAIARIRRREAARSAKSIGACYHCLEERDVDVVFDHLSNHKAIDLFRRLTPNLVFTHPRIDYMLDHEQTHLLARSAAFAFPIRNASKLPLPPSAAVPWLYFVDPMEGLDLQGNPVKPTTIIDITASLDTKLQMLSCHASQRQWLRAHHGIDEYLQAVSRHARNRGKLIRKTYAEAFIQHRGHAFPSTDLLKTLLSKPARKKDSLS